ncbi:MAG: hypothetical protein S4CHLAM102_11050 [Chlamydiia bacterium]|nr:hypothetical protein [Chlamydiia bacterium]
MKRKETILIAVIINACLLIGLFVFALKPHANVEYKGSKAVAAKAEPTPQKSQSLEIETPSVDQVDRILSQYVEKSEPAEKVVMQNTPVEVAKTEEKQEAVSILPQDMQVPIKKPMTHLVQVTVKQGDALEKIAKVHKTTVEQIMDLNHLPDTRLKIGQVLMVPAQEKANGALQDQVVTGAKSAEKFYVVEPGDNPWTIAAKNQIKVKELLRVNNLDEEKAKKLKPGDKLKIR